MAGAPKMETQAATSLPARGLAVAAEDRALVAESQAGSQPAFEELVRRHRHRVFAVAGGILRRREDVEDVAQQVFVKAYLSLPRFDQRAAFSTWLYKITVNECWDFLRKKKVRPLVYESDLSEEQARQFNSSVESSVQGGLDTGQRLDLRQRVERLLESLDERDRTMLILKEVEGFSVEEIGRILELNANTVKVRLFRARRKMVALHRKRSKGQQPGG
ncbi:MAG TPA: sigma-70 family RNA polymerase sigma factor [Candidatus Acidoferrales bacterium]|nr:sigma-70 family RNA polymerase sigma factor [Candidatus Acidoferrales bacterium]